MKNFGRRSDRCATVDRPAPRQHRITRGLQLILGLFGALALSPAQSAQKHTVDKATGIETWETSVAGVSVLLTQILPDQLRAFYVNRGFSVAAIESYARSCVYMTVLRNDTAAGVARFRLTDWRIVSGSETRPPLSTASWIERLKPAAQGNAPMIAFRWAQFPPEHAYQPGGDWNQGMLSMGLRPGEVFSLIASWTVDGQRFEGELKNVRCARESR